MHSELIETLNVLKSEVFFISGIAKYMNMAFGKDESVLFMEVS